MIKISVLRKALVCLALAPSVVAMAQEYTLSDALSGQKIPLVMKPADIPDDFRAIKLMGTGGGGLGDMFGMGSMFPMVLAMGNNNMSQTESMIMQIWPITWTRGEVVRIVGQDYIIAYGMDLAPNSLKMIGGQKKLPPFNLKLKLVKTTEMGSITPTPEWSKERYLRAIALVVNPKAMTMRVNHPGAPSTNDANSTPQIDSNAISKIVENPNTKHSGQITESDLTNMTAPTIDPKSLPPTSGTGNTGENQGTDPMVAQPAPPKTAVKAASTMRPIDASLYKSALDNAKVASGAMLLFAQDHNGAFPYVQSAKSAFSLISSYMNGMQPNTLNPVHPGTFQMNMCLAGVSMSDITHPGQTPLFYDPYMWPNGTMLVGFADSHAMFLTISEWVLAKRNMQLKLKKVGAPLPAELGSGGGSL